MSEFLRKILDQLSLSAWLPATMLVGCAALLLQLAALASVDIGAAILALAEKPFGIIVILLFALILTAIIVQAFSFEVIRFLEGYWGASSLGAIVAHVLIEIQLRRVRKISNQRDKQEKRAFRRAHERMLSRNIPRSILTILEDDVYRRRGVHSQADKDEARRLGWRQFAAPQDLARFDRLSKRLDDFPAEHRILPTKLGNVLRSAEDALELADGDLEGLVMRRYDRIPERIRTHHDQFRTRLDMYCILFFVFIVLAMLSTLIVWRTQGQLLSFLFPATFALLALTAYAASITSARGYGASLRAIQRGPA
ncbi:hypothetical protein [Pseudonocardia hydrocarbonoxydans]|uniref:hypothetical protein n=1 Tax=Pseudonocardia hydrocarbonoxydans TaxID=76726 RepID=UPI001142D9C6|nr:hypothetical protein [Pseudonocardia hydrocarbonoxydans]